MASVLGLAALAAGPSCKRPMQTTIPEVWDEATDESKSSAMDEFAPRWTTPTITALDDGLVTVWLNEADSPALHARLVFATEGISAEATAARVRCG